MLKTLKLPLVAVALLAAATAHAADPSPNQIYQAVQNGQLVQAQQMIGQVLKDHPDNAKAHYIAAEVDARAGDLAAARQQLLQARRLDPGLSFATPHSVSELEAQLSGRRAPGAGLVPAVVPAHRSSVPWGLIVVLGAGGLLVWSLFRRRQAAYYPQPPSYGYGGAVPPAGPGPQPYGPGYGYPPPVGGGLGTGIMGGLATGLAVGAGVAAGEALVDRVIDGHGHPGYVPDSQADPRDTPVNQDEGGYDFGTGDGNSWGNDSAGGGDFFGGGGDGGSDWT